MQGCPYDLHRLELAAIYPLYKGKIFFLELLPVAERGPPRYPQPCASPSRESAHSLALRRLWEQGDVNPQGEPLCSVQWAGELAGLVISINNGALNYYFL